jgi:HK97 family phage prohead protease
MKTERQQLRQVRSIEAGFHTRDAEGGPIIEGYFAVFNSDYEIWPGAIEQVAPGAFTSALGGDVRALADHDTRIVLGRTAAGTLELREDDRGLFGTIKINPEDQEAMNLYHRVQRGDVTQCSFGFDIVAEDYEHRPDGSDLWIIRDVVLYEVSVVTFPAYAETSVQARQADIKTIRSRQLAARKSALKERIAKWH